MCVPQIVPVSSFHMRLIQCGERSKRRWSSGLSHHCSVRSSKNLRFSRAGLSTTVSLTTPMLTQSAWVHGLFGTMGERGIAQSRDTRNWLGPLFPVPLQQGDFRAANCVAQVVTHLHKLAQV